jgi:hypothetical protein
LVTGEAGYIGIQTAQSLAGEGVSTQPRELLQLLPSDNSPVSLNEEFLSSHYAFLPILKSEHLVDELIIHFSGTSGFRRVN